MPTPLTWDSPANLTWDSPSLTWDSEITEDRNNQNILALAYLLWNHLAHGTQTLDRALGGL